MTPPVSSILSPEASAKSGGRIEYDFIVPENNPVTVNISSFPGTSGVSEYHLIILPQEYADIKIQLEWMHQAYRDALDSLGLPLETVVTRRFFLSDMGNQKDALKASSFFSSENQKSPCAVSLIGQPPVFPAKVALMAYHVNDPHCELDMTCEGTGATMRRGKMLHHWTSGLHGKTGELPDVQTREIFSEYLDYLQENEMTLSENVIRTWFYVRDIDSNYPGLVSARRKIFEAHGLTPQTHFIASSGIEGVHAKAAVKVTMDSYAISGINPEQIEFIKATDHLSPTHIYGVTFERATSVAWRDRRHVYISGTASIDCNGEIVHPGDVSRQLDRTLENINALLNQADASLMDMCAFIVYVRDPNDALLAWSQMREIFDKTPITVVTAPVCRSGWLIEIEGTAIVPAFNPDMPEF